MKAVLQWVLKTMMKDQTGIVQTMPKKDIVDFNVAMTMERLMRNGVDPNSLKNANQVENALNMIENKPRKQKTIGEARGIKSTKSAKVFDLEGKEIDPKKGIMGGKQIDDDLPPPGSRGGKDDIAAPVQSAEETIKNMIEAENRKNIAKMRNRKMVKDAIDNVSPGFVKGDRKYNAQLVAEDLADKKFGKDFYDLDQKQQNDLYGEALDGLSVDLEDFATGGRAGFKDGMTRRTFLKLLGGMAAVPIVGKFFKLAKVGKTVTKVPVIKTDDVAGKPEWFDALVNKVIAEGDDVTKKFATQERQIVHSKDLGDGTTVRVTQDMDQGAVRVEYDSADNVFEDTVQMEYKKPLPDEGDPRPTAEFTTAESGPVGRRSGPDDFDIEVDEVGGTSIRDLDSDVSKLKQYATGKGPTMKEIVEIKKRKDRARQMTEDPETQMDAIIRRQGDYDPSDYDDYASGGIARLLGE